MNKSFVAIDIETANESRSSICQIAIAVVEDGKIVRSNEWNVKPKELRFSPINTFIHGICFDDVKYAAEFPAIWAHILPEIEGKLILAHNVSFDMYALRDVLNSYDIPLPQFLFYCTLAHCKRTMVLEKYSLPNVCRQMGIDFTFHHKARYDAIACAEIGQKINIEPEYCREFQQELHRNQREHSTPLRVADVSGIEIFDLSEVATFETFKGKNIVVTGVFMGITRAEAEAFVLKLGAKLAAKINAKTSLVIMGAMAGPSKIDTLKELNKTMFIPVVDEKEYLETLKALALI